MDFRTWEKLKEGAKKAHPLSRIRKLHPIIQNPRIPKKIREEARELAAKARVELDSQHFWRWGGTSVLPTSKGPQLEEQVKEEGPKRTLEQTVDNAAPDVKPKDEMKADMKYGGSGAENGYASQGYESQASSNTYQNADEGPRKSREESMATTSEKLNDTKYHRKAKLDNY